MNAAAPPPASEAKRHAASALLEDLAEAFPADDVSVGELVDRLDARAHGVLLLVLALPMCVPNVPGISTIFGILMLAPAIQLVMGSRRLWLPRRVRSWTIDGETLRRTLRRGAPALQRVEFLIRPRWWRLTGFPFTILVGLQTLLMAFILILPIPFANWPPGMTVAMTALALLQRDGVLMLLTVPAAIASVASVYFGAWFGLFVLSNAAEWLRHFF